MPLIEELEANGRWLFRWRSYLPLVSVVLILASLRYFQYPLGNPWLDQAWECFCLLVGLSGLMIRGLVAAYVPRRASGRNTKRQIAETLNTTGMYSVVRNPLYVGNLLMGLSIVLFLCVWWLPVIYLLAFGLYYERIVFAEEIFLRRKFGEAYLAWASQTPVFLPKLSRWRRPALPFSWRTLLKREYQSACGLIVSLFALEQLTELYLGHGWHVDTMWMWVVGVTLSAYLTTRVFHKRTRAAASAGKVKRCPSYHIKKFV